MDPQLDHYIVLDFTHSHIIAHNCIYLHLEYNRNTRIGSDKLIKVNDKHSKTYKYKEWLSLDNQNYNYSYFTVTVHST